MFDPTKIDAGGRVKIIDNHSGKVCRVAPVDARQSCASGVAQPFSETPIKTVKMGGPGGEITINCDPDKGVDDTVIWKPRGYEVVDEKPAPEVDTKLEDLREEYERVTGEKPHHNAKAETLRDRIDAAKKTAPATEAAKPTKD